ncbi:hypothetical protein B0H12DRAFT_1231152 [Mycena haematopus]|nr:hypothetical protein B0H12DRAFT_1231152 [Mycena haematopus]
MSPGRRNAAASIPAPPFSTSSPSSPQMSRQPSKAEKAQEREGSGVSLGPSEGDDARDHDDGHENNEVEGETDSPGTSISPPPVVVRPSNERSMAKQTPTSYNKTLHAANVDAATPATVNMSSVSAGTSSTRAKKSVTQAPSTASLGDDGKAKRATVASAMAKIADVRAEIFDDMEDLRKEVSDGGSANAACRVRIEAINRTIARHDAELRSLRDELADVRRANERRGIGSSTGSSTDDEDVEVAMDHPKRKAASPLPASGKRQRQSGAQKKENMGESSNTHKMPLQARISDAHPNLPHGPPPNLPPSHRAAAPNPYPPAVGPSVPLPAAGPNRLAGMDGPSTNTALHQSSDVGRRESSSNNRGRRGEGWSSRGMAGRGRGGGKGKGRDHDHDLASLPPPSFATTPAAEVEVGPVIWGVRSRDTFIRFCNVIDATAYGPVPHPTWVSNPDSLDFVIARFANRFDAVRLATAWNAWCRDTQYHNTSANLLD